VVQAQKTIEKECGGEIYVIDTEYNQIKNKHVDSLIVNDVFTRCPTEMVYVKEVIGKSECEIAKMVFPKEKIRALAKDSIEHIGINLICEMKTGRPLYMTFSLGHHDLSLEESSSTAITLKEINMLEKLIKKEYRYAFSGGCPENKISPYIHVGIRFYKCVD
jgi:hypothetical protein